MDNHRKISKEGFRTGAPIRTPLSEESAGWSATLPGLDPSGRTEESFFPLNVAPQLELSGFVPVLFARTWEQAVAIVAWLEEDDILAVLEHAHPRLASFSTLSRGIPVLVPEECLDRASEKIAQREQDKNPFQRGPAREKYGDDGKNDGKDDGENDDDPYDDDDEYEDDDPSDGDDTDSEDDEDDQFDYDDD